MSNTKSKLLFLCACDKCGSKDNVKVYEDGSSYCFTPGCKAYTNNKITEEDIKSYKERGVLMTSEVQPVRAGTSSSSNDTQVRTESVREFLKIPKALPDRGISKEKATKYGIYSLVDKTSGEVIKHLYEYRDKETGEPTGNKVRTLPKAFSFIGRTTNHQLFGQHLVPSGGKFLTITEGELDAASVEEMTGYPAVSVKSGGSAKKDVTLNYEYCKSFQTIVIAFDTDKGKTGPDGVTRYPGQEAAREIATMFKPGTVKIINHGDLKDANDYLVAGRGGEYKNLWWNAPVYTPDGIVAMADTWDEVSNEDIVHSTPTPWYGLNELIYGLRMSELITLTGGTGMGKSQILRELEHHLLMTTEDNIGLLNLEESHKDSALGIMSVDASIPFHLPDSEYTTEDKRRAFENTLGTGRVYAFDSFGSNSIENILQRVRYMATALDCKYIILDHVSIVVSDQGNGDERKALDEITTKLKTLIMELDICLVMVCHLRRTSGKPAEEGGRTSLSDLRGTAGIGQMSNIVIGIERNGQADDEIERNTTTLRVLKSRFTGRTGAACNLLFDRDTYRLSEVIEDTVTDEFSEPDGSEFD